MTPNDLSEAYERELTDPGFDPYEPDHTWTSACKRPVSRGMTGKVLVAAGCAGLALGLLLVAVVQ